MHTVGFPKRWFHFSSLLLFFLANWRKCPMKLVQLFKNQKRYIPKKKNIFIHKKQIVETEQFLQNWKENSKKLLVCRACELQFSWIWVLNYWPEATQSYLHFFAAELERKSEKLLVCMLWAEQQFSWAWVLDLLTC